MTAWNSSCRAPKLASLMLGLALSTGCGDVREDAPETQTDMAVGQVQSQLDAPYVTLFSDYYFAGRPSTSAPGITLTRS